MKGFINFIREQGVIGLAVGFLLGGSVTKLVQALVSDIINPILGIFLGFASNLADAQLKIAGINILWGHFVATLIDFAIVAGVVYLLVHVFGLDKLDRKKVAKN